MLFKRCLHALKILYLYVDLTVLYDSCSQFLPSNICRLDSLSPNFERRNSQNNQRNRSSSDGALGLRKTARPERKGINENWRHPVEERKEAGFSRTSSNAESRQDSTRVQEKNPGENNQNNFKRNNHAAQGTTGTVRSEM